MKVRKHIYFSGRVQGVGFRFQARHLAKSLQLTGWVKNLWDGRVEMEVQGENAIIQRFLYQLKGERFIVIRDMEMENLPLEDEKGFITL